MFIRASVQRVWTIDAALAHCFANHGAKLKARVGE